ncbi:MAG: hypothetical protein KAX99_02240 [Azonexus sp.]|nr:hypothetical protein [Azonexus sp.]
MKAMIVLVALCLSGCGLETAGSAAAVGKLQAENAKQAKENMGAMKASIEASTKEAEAKNKALEDAGKN